MTVTIQGTTYPLDDNEGRYIWASLVPTCPICEQPLTPLNETETHRAAIDSRWHDDHRVTCDGCGWESGRLS